MFEKYSRTGASRNVRMSLRFAFSSPAHVIATFGGSGLLHPAPGTWGTAAGLVVYIALERRIPLAGWIAILLASFFLGAWASHVTGKDMGVHDHGSGDLADAADRSGDVALADRGVCRVPLLRYRQTASHRLF